MIPKIIHYCWLSNDPIPKNLRKCMSTWEKYLPEYEFMLWNFERFPKSKSKWVSDAYDNKKSQMSLFFNAGKLSTVGESVSSDMDSAYTSMYR